MKIPIQNIYYLLSYAWNKLDEQDRIKVDLDGDINTLDLLGRILISGTKVLLRKGLLNNYNITISEVAGIKGKLELTLTLKRNLLAKQRTICSFDEYTPTDILNQIVFSTFQNIIKVKDLNKDIKQDINYLTPFFSSISSIKLTKSTFSNIRFNRNNKYYQLLINVCELINECLLPSEKAGEYMFIDFSRDERKMNRLFESFIFNFFQRNQECYEVRRMKINWKLEPCIPTNEIYLPEMRTDVTLDNKNERIIIDAKYYQETLNSYFGSEKIISNNLYQIFSYLINQEDEEPKTLSAKGLLIYPTIKHNYELDYTYGNHKISVRTIDLNQSWMKIEEKLLDIIKL